MDYFFELIIKVFNFIRSVVYTGMLQAGANIAEISSSEVKLIEVIYNAVLPAGMAIMVSLALFDILKNIVEHGFENITFNQIIAPLAKIAFLTIFMSYSATFIGRIIGMSNYLIGGKITTLNTAMISMVVDMSSEIDATPIVAAMTDGNPVFAAIKLEGYFYLLYSMGFSAVVGLILAVVAMAKLFIELICTKAEMIIRFALTPLAIANVCSHDHRGGVKFLKKTIASGVALYAMIGAVAVTWAIATGLSNLSVEISDSIKLASTFMITQITGPFAAVAAARKAKQVVLEALG